METWPTARSRLGRPRSGCVHSTSWANQPPYPADPRPDGVSEPIPFNRPLVAGSELGYLEEAIAQRDLAGGGEFTRRCQEWLRRATGSPLALLSHSATGALEAAAMLAGLGPGDEAVMPSFGYPTMATAVVRQGAKPVFVDIDPVTLNVDPERVAAAVGERTRAVFAVHYGGVACDMGRLGAI